MSSSVSLFKTASVLLPTLSGGLILPPPPPPPPPSGDEDDDLSDDESDFGGDDDNDYHNDQQHSTNMIGSSASLQTSTLPLTTMLTTSSILSSVTMGTIPVTTQSSLSLDSTTRSSTTAPTRAAQTPNPGTVDSIPQNQADPAIESRVMATPLGTAGIVLVAIFGCVALVTTIYFFSRMRRRRQGHESNGKNRQDFQRSGSNGVLEKGMSWATTTQETGIIFGHRSTTSQPSPPTPRGRGRFSFLNRRWYSTGSEATAAQARRSPPPSPPRWAAGLFGLGLRSQAGTARARSVSTSVLEAPYESPTKEPDRIPTDLERSSSQRSGGDGHARAYAHHNVKAPRSVRNTMISISSRLIRRKDRGQRSPTFLSVASPAETSELYHGSRRTTLSSERLMRPGRESSMTVPPRIPLPVAMGQSRRLSNRSV